MISYDEFAKIDLRIGKIISAERVPNSEKLLKLSIDIGEISAETNEPALRQILAGIGKAYEPETLINRELVVIANLEPRMLMGLESQGMVLAADHDTPVILLPEKEVKPGAKIK